ncbi:MAG: hypothetical protein ACHRXM_28295 [Isosphaerales bacterium]
MRILSMSAACYLLASLLVIRAQAGVEVVASKSLTIQPSGPRTGEAGTKYFNIQGKDNQKFASFGVLNFEIPKEVHDKKVKSVTLTLVQSIPRFAKDGAIRFFLAPEPDAASDLKFDPSASDGVGSQIKPLHALGSGNFKKIETGKTESFSLTVDDAVRERIAKGGKLCLVIVPADSTVAATYVGASEDAKKNSPRLTLDLP